jgi:hypothetical protein
MANIADSSWVLTPEQESLYVRAQALGADTFVLSKESRAVTFLETKSGNYSHFNVSSLLCVAYCIVYSYSLPFTI